MKPVPMYPRRQPTTVDQLFQGHEGRKVLDPQFEKRLVPIMDLPCLVADLEYV